MRNFKFAQRGAPLLLVGIVALLLISSQFLAKSAGDGFYAQDSVFKLGRFVEFDLAVKEINAAQKFYESLGFKNTAAGQPEHPIAAVTDGSVVLALHQAEFKSPTITYFGSNVAECLRVLQENNIDAKVLKREDGETAQVEFADINGQRIVLKAQAPEQRQGVSFEMMTPAGPTGKEKHYSKCGIFGEFSIPVKDRAASAAFWQKLGFQKMFESDAPYPWGIYSDGVTVLGIHQTTEFKESALSFFSKDSKDRIAALKKEGFQFLVDLDPTNSVLKSPDGQMIFVFNLP